MRLAPVESETENAPKQQESPCAPSALFLRPTCDDCLVVYKDLYS